MQQHEQTVGLLEAIFGGSNASMSENSEQELQRYSKTIPRIEMILSVMYGGDKRALEQDMSIARTTVWRFATSGISPNMANKLERKLGLPAGCIHNEAISHEHFLSIVQSVHQRRHPDTAYLVRTGCHLCPGAGWAGRRLFGAAPAVLRPQRADGHANAGDARHRASAAARSMSARHPSAQTSRGGSHAGA